MRRCQVCSFSRHYNLASAMKSLVERKLLAVDSKFVC